MAVTIMAVTMAATVMAVTMTATTKAVTAPATTMTVTMMAMTMAATVMAVTGVLGPAFDDAPHSPVFQLLLTAGNARVLVIGK
jgi:hypothetical protein